MLLFPACCHILFYLGLGVGCFFWSEACGVSNLKIDSDTSYAQIAHKSCSTHAGFMLLNTKHKSRLGHWIVTFFWVCSWQMSRLYLSFIPEPALPSPCVIESMDALTQGMTRNRRGDAFGWESAAVPAALGAPPQGFLSAKTLWREQCLNLDCE